MKGHNGFCPCRACRIIGVCDPSNPKSPYYTPLHHSFSPAPSYDALKLPLCTHDELIRQAIQIQNAPTDAEEERRSREFGINGVPILSRVSSLSFPHSFPHDFMHLMFENVIPTLINLWTGEFKQLKEDTRSESYLLSKSDWNEIGQACALSGETIPSAFGCQVPDIAKNPSHLIAESRLLFTTLLAPTLLHHKLKKKYYDHFILLVKLINKCLSFEITRDDVNDIEHGFAQWVQEFER